MADTTGIFKGSSAYSADFSQAVDRAVGIAGLPIRLLTAQKTTLSDQKTELESVNAKFLGLQGAVNQLAQALDGSSFLTSVADSSVVDATVSQGVVEGNYSVTVSDVGAYASSLTSSTWAAASGAHTYKLVLGTGEHTILTAETSASGVAAAINEQYGEQVRASVVNVGTAAAPDNRISLQGVRLGDTPVGLKDNGVNVQAAQTVGRLASYEVQGSGKTVTSNTRTVTVATGLTVTMLSSSSSAVNITVTRSTSALSDALTAFTDAFNAATDAVDQQRGQGGGKLQGQSLVQDLAGVLSALGTYNAADSSVGSLANLGVELGRDGRLSFSPFALMGADMVNSNGITSFLGSTTGSGFLKLANDRLQSLENTSTGTLTRALEDLSTRITGSDEAIAKKQDAVDQLQERLLQQMAAADALVAAMQQQYAYFSSMFAAMTSASQSYQ